jgi:predicted lipoprotein with Yx(FWY)xxD motif
MKSSGNPRRRLWAFTGTGTLVLVAVVLGMGAMSSAATSNSKSASLQVAKGTLSGPSGDKSEPIAVTSKGLAVYELSPETTHRLLCTKGNGCFSVWPPLKVKSTHVSKASGVKGHLGTFRRNGFIQLTLNGHPLYTFVEDGGKKGVAAGDGLKAFGGTWHVFKEGKTQSTNQTPPPAPMPIGYTTR